MAQIIEAVFTGGVLKPDENLGLRECQRVRLTIEPLDDQVASVDRESALQRLLAGIDGMKFFSSGPLPTRDELHDRT